MAGLDISTDADFLKEIEGLDLDDLSIGTGSPLRNNTNSRTDKNQGNKNARPKRRPPMKKMKLDLDALFMNSDINKMEDNENEPNLFNDNHKEKDDMDLFGNNSSVLSILESRISNYLNTSLLALQQDFLYEIKNLFDNSGYTPIVDSFLMQIASEIRNEVQFSDDVTTSFEKIQSTIAEINEIPLDINTDFPYLKMKETLSRRSIQSMMNQIEVVKSHCVKDIAKSKNEIADEIQARDAIILQNETDKKNFQRRYANLLRKSLKLESKYTHLEFERNSLDRQMNLLNDQIEDLESSKSGYNEKEYAYSDLQEFLDDFQIDLPLKRKDNKQMILQNKLNRLLEENKDLIGCQYNVSTNAQKLAKSVSWLNSFNSQPPTYSIPQTTYSAPYTPQPQRPNISPIPEKQPPRNYYSDSPVTPRRNQSLYSLLESPQNLLSDFDNHQSMTVNSLLDNQFTSPMKSYV